MLQRADAPQVQMTKQIPRPCPICGRQKSEVVLRAPDRFHWRKEDFTLARCSNCATVWLVQPPQPAQMAFHYDEEYHRTIRTAGETDAFHRWKKHRGMIGGLKSSGAILDIGCSSGGFLSTMKGANWRLHGIELEPSVAEQASVNTGGDIFAGDIPDAPFPDASFDVITCFDVLEHVYDPRQVLTKAYSWLKPGGILVIALPNIESIESRILRSYWYGLELPRHLFHFSPRSLRYIMESIGLKENTLATSGSYVERSAGYLLCALLDAMGRTPVPQSRPRSAGLVWKLVRKAMRSAFLRPASWMASAAGAGAGIEAIFIKEV